MEFELQEDHRMLLDLVQKFVRNELLPLEQEVLIREADGGDPALLPEQKAHLDKVSKELGLWSLDAPESSGGMGMPYVALVGVNEAMGSTVAHYTLPPDSPNLRMLEATCNGQQKEAYLDPYSRGETLSAIGISEPGAGADPSGMKTRAIRDGDDWVINGRKIWITRADESDFTILMAITETRKKGQKAACRPFWLTATRPASMWCGGFRCWPVNILMKWNSTMCACRVGNCLARKALALRPCRCGLAQGGWRWRPGALARRSARLT